MDLRRARISGVVGVVSLLAVAGQAITYGAASGDAPLIDAAKRPDMSAVRALLQTDADVNAVDIDGSTALHWAAYHDSLETVQLLLRDGANPGTANRYGSTPLWLATVNGNAEIVGRLLQAGVDANATRVDSGETALMIAAQSGHSDVVRVLLASGANVQAAESVRGQTALMWAAAEAHPEVVKVLLEAGADMTVHSNGKMSPLMWAIRSGDIETTRLMLDAGASMEERSADGTSMLVLAILNANFEVANYLLERGADPNVDDPHGNPLFVLTWLRSAVNRSLTNILVRTPFGTMDSVDLGKALLAHGANVNERIDWEDPGAKATRGRRGGIYRPGHLAIGPYFLSFVGATPFYIAAMNCDVPYMKFLAENGADARIATKQNSTPLLIASGIGFYEGEHPGTPSECLQAVKLAHEMGNDPKGVVEYGDYNVGSPNWNGATALHGAATRGADEMVEWLVQQGVPLDAKTAKGMTAWDIADGSNITGVFHQWIETAALLRRMMEDRNIPVVVSAERSSKDY
jgi:ankyrin repeat protein